MSRNWLWGKQQQPVARLEPGGLVLSASEHAHLGCEPRLAERQSGNQREQQTFNQAELRLLIQTNRERWLANATRPVSSQFPVERFASATLPGYAIIIGLATVVLLTGISLAQQIGESASSDPAATRIALSKATSP